MYEQRDIVFVSIPEGVRPALIISNSGLRDTRICLLISSKKTKDAIFIGKDEMKLPLKSYIIPSKVFIIAEKNIKRRLGTISKPLFERALRELRRYYEEDRGF